MTQISSRHLGHRFNRSSRSSQLSKDKIIALVSFLMLVLFACATFISYLFLPEENDIDVLDPESGKSPHKLGLIKPFLNRKRHKHRKEKMQERVPSTDREGQRSSKKDLISRRAIIQKQYNEMFPTDTEEDTQRLRDFVNEIRKPKHELKKDLKAKLPYDVNNCPEEPPDNYPFEWPLLEVLGNWRPSNISSSFRPEIYQGLCRFDYRTEMHKAENYREAEQPFLLRDDPKVLRVVERWNQPDFLPDLLGRDTTYSTEYSESNSLMWFKMRDRTPDSWEKPMSTVRLTYDEWAEKASQPEEDMGPNKEHWYFRVNAKSGNDHFLFEELPFFLPEENFYIVDSKDTRGINCRYGMLGNTAAAHFDGSRNFVMLFGGERRYILSHPKNCRKLGLYPRSHPSGRHSAIDWSNPDLDTYPEFADARANEVVLQAGDVLYLPTMWFHYIVSLDLNWQCNARSGITSHYKEHIRRCGF